MLSVLPDAVVTTLGTPVTIHVLANDSGSGLTITSFSNPAHGSVIFNADQSFTYAPTTGFVGTDSFAYTVRDAQGTPSGAEVTITVAPNDGATRATDDYIEMIAGGNAIIPVLSNDLTATGSLRLIAISVPGHGAANVLADQSIRYVPQSGFVGIDSFTYTVIDQAGTTTSAIVTVKVLAENRTPLAKGDAFTLEAGQTTVLAILGNDSDPDGDPLQVVSYTMPSHGSLAFNPDKTFSYTPNAGYQGADQFTYTIRDNRGASASASVLLTIAETAEQPTATDDHVVTEAGMPAVIDVLGNDGLPVGQEIRIVAVTLPFKGKIVFNLDGTITYTPNMGFVGFDDFTYTIGNGLGGTAKATVTIEVTPAVEASVYVNGYSYRRRIVVPAQGSAQATAEEVVILITEEAAWLKSVENGGKVALANGSDLRFEDILGGKLDHDLEHYDPALGKLTAWVRLPSWNLAQQMQLLLYYGNAAVAGSEADPAGTWRGYLARWQLPDGSDATGRGRDLTPQNVSAGTLLGAAAKFAGDGNLRLAETSWLGGLTAFTMQALVKADPSVVGSTKGILVQGSPDSTVWNNGLTISLIAETSSGIPNVLHVKANCTDGVIYAMSDANRHTTAPQLIHGTWRAGDAPDIYLDGVKRTQTKSGARSGTTSVTGPLYIGDGWQGMIDEVRLADRVLPADWLIFESRNMLTPELSYALGAEERINALDLPPIAVPYVTSTTSGKFVEIDVLGQADQPAGSPPLTLTNISQPTHGLASVIANTVRYTPNADFIGHDQFTYTISNATKSAVGQLGITVKPAVSQPSGGTGMVLPTAKRTLAVGNASELATALAAALPGDHIILGNGEYSGSFDLEKTATGDNPIVVRAANLNQARITGRLNVKGSHLWAWGIEFQGASARIDLEGADHKVLACWFEGWGSGFSTHSAINLFQRTDRLEIGYCTLTKPGAFPSWSSGDPTPLRIGIRGRHEIDRAAYDTHIHHCYFYDFPDKPASSYSSGQADAIEMAPIGINADTRWKIEYNRFEQIRVDSGSIIDMKGGRKCVARFNTAVSCGGRIDLRSVSEAKVEHNWLKATQGIGVFGIDHQIVGNRLIDGGYIRLLKGTVQGPDILNGEQVKNALVRCNTGTLRVGVDFSTGTWPVLGTQVDGHSGAITYGSHSGTVANDNYACSADQAFELMTAEVGPAAAPI